MFIPLHDANSLKHIRMQYVTIGLIVANVVVWLMTTFSSESFAQATAIGLGYIPSTIYDLAERGKVDRSTVAKAFADLRLDDPTAVAGRTQEGSDA